MKASPPRKLLMIAGVLAALLGCGSELSAQSIARDFTVVNRTPRQTIRLSDYAGQIVVLDFFAYWCGPCQTSSPDVELNIQQYYAARGGNPAGLPVKVLSLNLETTNSAATDAFVAAVGATLVADDFSPYGAWAQFGQGYIPHFVIINGAAHSTTHRQWEVLYSDYGYAGAAALRQRIDAIQAPALTLPVFSIHPSNASVGAGQSATLNGSVTNGTAMTYQWKRNGVAIPGATSANLSIPSVQHFHAGAYTVVATNTAGSSESGAGTLTVAAPPANNARLLNLSTRGLAQTGDNVLIPGFVVSGSANKRLLIRAVGPTLSGYPFNLGNTVAPDPTMTLRRLDTSVDPAMYVDVASNDDWGANANAADIAATATQLFAFELQDSREAALLRDLPPGQYTVTATDKNGTSGLAIVELYDADAGSPASRLINISNRGFCGVGDNVMIPGFVVSAEGPKTVLVRVVGPTLAGFNVTGTMADPKLTIYSGQTPILENDNWSDNPDAAHTAQVAAQVFAFPLTSGSKDAAFVVTLQPGSYTVVGSSAAAGGTGVVLVEVYVSP